MITSNFVKYIYNYLEIRGNLAIVLEAEIQYIKEMAVSICLTMLPHCMTSFSSAELSRKPSLRNVSVLSHFCLPLSDPRWAVFCLASCKRRGIHCKSLNLIHSQAVINFFLWRTNKILKFITFLHCLVNHYFPYNQFFFSFHCLV